MSLDIKGRLIQILPVQSGTSKAGNEWSKQEFVIETSEEQFPKKVCFTLFGDKVSLLNGINNGDEVEVAFNLESREFSGKWYHNINAWRISKVAQGADQNNTPGFGPNDVPPPPASATDDGPFPNDLPF
ncbi:MAG TPA: DUF3127 domain-containing protein [Prolixibacteraceae bacterium]|nr:DUF3127 domain-containing protein [Prolixibacteraceae bacterium]HPR61633.1 DUF3127 domain-containing protein [Prolixibacteraceae bacterium]